MDSRREELNSVLETILGSNHVYFQPPDNVRMKYPAIRYELSDIFDVRADNQAYYLRDQYTITYIDPRPDSRLVINKLASMPLCRFTRSYKSNNLNHYVFVLYY